MKSEKAPIYVSVLFTIFTLTVKVLNSKLGGTTKEGFEPPQRATPKPSFR